MKLKGLPNRAYNILFHTHTVAGISISAALFIIFYAGAFALFRHDVYQWENPAARIEQQQEVDFSKAMDAIAAYYPNFAPAEQLSFREPNEVMPFLQFFGAIENGEGEIERIKALIDISNNYEVIDVHQPITTVGDTLYHLHYFDQIPFGIHISGLVALFFLFATITGVLIHWRNIVTKFYAFTIKGKWKQIWTNAHTVLGVLGLPFQIIYAVTGALFGLLTLLLIPSAFILFGGDTDQVLATVRPESAIKIEKEAAAAEYAPLDTYLVQAKARFPENKVAVITCRNYGREDGLVTFYFDDERTLNGNGQLTYRLQSGELVSEAAPDDKGYTQSVLSLMTKLHFGTFGGYLLRITYFILALITCFMLISGMLLWQEARNNSRYTPKQRRFHHRVTKVNLAICLALFPATALLFIVNKLVPMDIAIRASYVNTAFFGGWLLLILAGLRWNNFRKLNKNYLLLGGSLSLLVPIVNGLMTGDWLWDTLSNGQFFVFAVDVFWLLTGITALMINYLVPVTATQEVQQAQPIYQKPFPTVVNS